MNRRLLGLAAVLPAVLLAGGLSIHGAYGQYAYESPDHPVSFIVPPGWDLEEAAGAPGNAPFAVMAGPESGAMRPLVTVGSIDTSGVSFDQLITMVDQIMGAQVDDGTEPDVTYAGRVTVNGMEAYEILAQADMPWGTLLLQSLLFYGPGQSYSVTYLNDADSFEADRHAFETVGGTLAVREGAGPVPVEGPLDNTQDNPDHGGDYAMCRAEGYSAGYDKGHDEGYTIGHEDGYDLGYERGYSAGYDKGFQEGFNTKLSK